MGVRERYYESQKKKQEEKEKEEKEGTKKLGVRERAFLKTLPSRLESLQNESNEVYEGYKSRFFDEDGNYVHNYRGDTEDAYNSYSSFKTKYDTESEAILSFLDTYESEFDSKTAKGIRDYFSNANKSFEDMMNAYKTDYDYWSKWDTEDEYNAAVKATEEYEGMKVADTVSLGKEIDALKSKKNEYLGIKNKRDEKYSTVRSGYMRAGYNKAQAEQKALEAVADYDKQLSVYGDMSKIDQDITKKEAYKNRASYIQEGIKLAEEAKNSKDFDKYAVADTTVDNSTYRYINDVDGYRAQQDDYWLKNATYTTDQGVSFPTVKPNYINNHYDQMTEEERKTYNYHYANGGAAKASEYLASIQETLNSREAGDMVDAYGDSTFLKTVFAAQAGYEQFTTGLSGLLDNRDYIPQTATQIASGQIRESLEDNGPKILGSSLGQIAYDAVNTTSNMLPSIMTSTVVGMINPVAGAAVGSAMMGASAAGNARAEMINLGYNKSQANSYAALVGGSEAALQYVLGGIGKLGGSLTGKVVGKLASGVNNAAAGIAIKFAGSMISEGIEESLQEILTPYFQNLVLHADNDWSDIDWQQVAYSGMLGALSAGLLEGGSVVSGEVNTYKAGKEVMDAGQTSNLVEFGKSFSADTVAYKLANKVTEKTGAYTIGKLLHEAGADSLSDANIADIKSDLESKGIAPEHAGTIAKWLNNAVRGEYFTKRQITALESNDDIATTFRDVIINQNSTVNQRMSRYNSILQNVAQYRADVEAGKTKVKTEEAEGAVVDETHVAPNSEKPVVSADNSKVDTVVSTENRFAEAEEGNIENSNNEKSSNVAEIASIKNGKMELRLDNNEVVSYDDVRLSKSEDTIYSAILDMGINTEGANALLKSYDSSKQSAEAFAHGIKEAYTYGRFNYSDDTMFKKGFSADLTAEQRNLAYQHGRIDEKARVAAKQAEIDAKKKTIEKKIEGKAGVHFDGDRMSLDKTRKVSLKVMEELSEKLGVHFFVYESFKKDGRYYYKDADGVVKPAPNGKYDLKTGAIYIDLNAGTGGVGKMLYTVAHELTHHIKEWSPAKFKILADFLVEKYGEAGVSVDDLVYKQIADAAKNDREIDYDTAFEEFVADSMETMLTSGDLAKSLAKLKSKDKGLWNAIKNFFSKWAKAISDAYAHLSPDSSEGKIVAKWKDTIDEIQALFVEGVVDASKNYSQAEVSAEKSSNKNDDTDLYRYMSRDVLEDVQALSRQESKNVDMLDVKNLARYYKEVYSAFHKTLPSGQMVLIGKTPDILVKYGAANGPIYLPQTAIKKNDVNGKHSLGEAVVYGLPVELVDPLAITGQTTKHVEAGDEGIVVWTNWKDSNENSIVVPIRIVEKTVFGEKANIAVTLFDVNEVEYAADLLREGNVKYTKKNESIVQLLSQRRYVPKAMASNAFEHIIEEFEGFVKEINEKLSERDIAQLDADYMKAVEDGDMDTAQRMVEEAAEKAMPNTKVTDKDGKIQLVYHGSPSKFTVFDHNKMNTNGNAHGRGFYFTEDKSLAEGYGKKGGQLLNGYLNIEKPLSEEKVTIKKTDLVKLVKATCEGEAQLLVEDGGYGSVREAVKDTWVSNYVDTYGANMNDVYREVANIIYSSNDNDVDIIAEMTNSGAGNEVVLTKVAETTGYDGVIYRNETTGNHEYVALTSNQFKSADPVTYDDNGDVIPLSERFDKSNDDIRYSDRDTADYAPTFYSYMGKTINEIKQNKIGASSVVAYLKGKGVKAEEIKWSGIEIWLEGKKSVTKEELQEFVAGVQLQIGEVTRSTNEDAYNELDKLWREHIGKALVNDFDLESGYFDGMKVKTELAFYEDNGYDMPTQDVQDRMAELADSFGPHTKWDEYKLEGGTNYREIVFTMPNATYTNSAMRAHWGEDAQGVLAHARIQDFDVNGQKMLFVEEIQSDWHNEGAKNGYKTEHSKEEMSEHKRLYDAIRSADTYDDRMAAYYALKEYEDAHPYLVRSGKEIPDAPFRNNYQEFVLKRLIRMAAEERYDSIGWTTAQTQADRWSDQYAEGYRIEYDQDIPKFLRKYGKKWGADVGKVQMQSGEFMKESQIEARALEILDEKGIVQFHWNWSREYGLAYEQAKSEIEQQGSFVEIWTMPITDAMKESVLYEGQAMFSDRDYDAEESYGVVSDQLAKENAELKNDVANLKELLKLQKKVTHGKMLSKTSVEAVANRLIKSANAKGTTSELAAHLNDVYSYILKGEDVSWEGIKAKAQGAVDWLASHEQKTRQRDEYADEVLKDLRSRRVSLNEQQKQEVAYTYGSYNNFRQKTMGSIIVSNDGISLDSLWQELCERYPSVFDADVVSNDQPAVLLDTIRNLQNSYVEDYYYEDEMARQDLLTSVYDSYWDVSTLHTVADKMQREISLLKSKHRQRMDSLRSKHLEREASLRKMYSEARKKATDKVRETRDKNEAKTKLQRLVLETSKWISYPKKGEIKCPDFLRVPYANFLQSIDFSSKTFLETDGLEHTKNDERMILAMNKLANAIANVKSAQDPATSSKEVLDSGYLDLPERFVEELRELAEKTESRIIDGDFVINRMSSSDIKSLSKLLRTLNHSIKEMSTLYSNMRFANVEALGDESITFMEDIGDTESTNAVADFAYWDNGLPYYVFKRFGKGGESVFEELMDAQDKLAFLAKDILDFKGRTWKDKEVSSWSDDTHTIKLPSGKEITLTTADAMSIYCLARRDNNQGLNHLVGGGVRVIGKKNGVKTKQDSRVNLDFQDVQAICSSLNERQKQVAEAMQEFMSTTCSEWGNEISMKRFLTKDFTEKRYFPIESNDEVLAVKDPQAQQSDLFRLLNISATKPLTPNANNSVIIRNIFDVFTEHTSDMARLNAFGMALLDTMKWLNYNEKSKNDSGQVSVRGLRGAMQKTYGDKALSYVINLVKDVNGRSKDGGDHPWLTKMTKAAKTAMVGANLRVSVLQLTAYPRASLILSNGSLVKGFMKKPQISKAKESCGIALWKSFGFYETNISRSIEDQIKGATNWKQKLVELSLKGAEFGDAITWGYLWNACEYEVAKTNKQLKVGTEEFNKAVAKKLREVVYSTQVVDSTLTRSQIMRNKSGLTQTATAFMSEPTVSANILMDAKFQFNLEKRRTGSAKAAWKKMGKQILRTVSVYTTSQLLVALVEGLMDAYRDDDEDEFIEKFGREFLENAITDVLPLNKIPILSDVTEFILSSFDIGYFSSDRLDTMWLTQLVSAIDSWKDVLGEENSSVTYYDAIYKTVRAASSMSGIPLSGAMREVVTLWNNTAGAADPYLKVRSYESSSTQVDIAERAFDQGKTGEVKGTVQKMVDEKVDGGKTEKEAKSAVRSIFTSRFKSSYISAAKSGNWAEANRIRKLLYATGLYGSLTELDATLKDWRTE